MNHAYGSAPEGVMDPPAVLLPGRDVFAARAQRLRDLAGRVEALSDFLAFMAQVAQAQQAALEQGCRPGSPNPRHSPWRWSMEWLP
ncbi:formate dehydrogenase accessory protein FdhE domain-containing protein [Modicisalibacter luteus]|uniref:formate dehydrogenase accessory protein FdhE domain-containing protein n=1 Tax=Modicisalibacter luteus TaxID=453962 RepID=UPI00363B12C3